MSSTHKRPKYLIIKLLEFETTAPETKQAHDLYFSVTVNGKMYFSSCMPSSTGTLSDDIIVPAFEKLETVDLNRWENHMVMFTYDLDISQLRTRNTIMKKIETKYGEYLKLLIVALPEDELKLGLKYVDSITQHYLFIDQMTIVGNESNRNDEGPSYFRVKTESATFVMPVMDGQLLIKLPETIQFFRVKNGKQIGRSSTYPSSSLQQQQKIIELDSINGYKQQSVLKMQLKWGINLQQARPQNNLLLDSQQLMIYDIEVKFDNGSEYGNCKIKFVYGNKAFQLGNQFSSAKPAKIKKIINFITKSEEEELILLVERNLKPVAQAKFQVQEIIPFVVNSSKKKITDLTGKPIGTIKFKCQKAKNLSTPSNNKIWRQSLKTKAISNQLLLVFDQISIKYDQDSQVCLSLKTQSSEKVTKNLPNLLHFDKNQQVTASPLALNCKADESVYMIAKEPHESEINTSDFIGIALFNSAQVRFGLSCVQLKFFKNQTHTITINCLVNKIAAYPFIKPTFQPELLQSLTHRSISLSVIMREVYFSPFFYTFRYDNKNEVYCIVEVNRLKKVLIMENKNKSNELSFNCSASSDNLDFSIQETETIKMKVTFLVSDIGQDQEIYGWSLVKFKASQLQSASSSLKFYLVQIRNDFGSNLGQINVEVHKASLFNSHVKESRDILESGNKVIEGEKRKVKMHLAQISQSVELKEKSHEAIKAQDSKKPSLRYEKITPLIPSDRRKRNNSVIGIEGTLKLPAIREQSASPQGKKNYNELVHMMKIRKRSMKGHYEENSMLESYQMRNYNNNSILKGSYKGDQSPSVQTFHLKQKIEKENPNISRNMEILFPKKSPRSQRTNYLKRPPIKCQQQKLKGLKSVMNEITSDMGQIQPTVKDQDKYRKDSKHSQRPKYGSYDEIDHTKGPEWDDNQFAL